ncbi:alpha/beta fold hydrolase [Devosia nitrariae]|uniref:Hydrolase n=1 Tax=Devosia nitrariae TaxID=2071872 RepID=A0ABQ5W9U6_9HYPH|nr:alpha/beta fold hydrolase [Devosia nitrariae]GLQ56700.1 hydrolase [Devosia nitrariae]
MTGSVTSETLAVPGGRIYYEQRGDGPLLLIIPGGPQDAGIFAELAGLLADRYTVVAYDPRGNSRSPIESEWTNQDLDVHGDDAARLIEALSGGEPAHVFGTSGGAQIGLNLAARHPQRVKTLVAHEPPTIMLLEDPSEALAADRAIYDTYRRDGVEAAMAQFFADAGLETEGQGDAPPEFDMPPEAAETFARVSGNFEYWLAHGMIPLSVYIPDVPRLRAGEPRIVVAIGEKSAGQPIAAMGAALADKLDIAPVAFPGDHLGFEQDAPAFADALDVALRQP